MKKAQFQIPNFFQKNFISALLVIQYVLDRIYVRQVQYIILKVDKKQVLKECEVVLTARLGLNCVLVHLRLVMFQALMLQLFNGISSRVQFLQGIARNHSNNM